jgi:hypothetical protein
MITKIYANKIKHQSNIKMFVWGCNNLIESKSKQVMNTNSKLTKSWRIKLIKEKLKKTQLKEKKNRRWN